MTPLARSDIKLPQVMNGVNDIIVYHLECTV